MEEKDNRRYLMCERKEIYRLLIFVAGFWGAYTYALRGGVFCNAQTGNVVLMGLAIGAGKWREALYYLIPISAYTLGAFVSEYFPDPVKRRLLVRWETILIALEMLAVLCLGFIPLSAPVQIVQVTINFFASMQYNTFRAAEGIPMATTFTTNHIRQIGIALAEEAGRAYGENASHRKRLREHCAMLAIFLTGVAVGALLCRLLDEKAIWATLLPLGAVLVVFLHADFVREKELKERTPAGH